MQLKKKKEALYVLMWNNPQDILLSEKGKEENSM